METNLICSKYTYIMMWNNIVKKNDRRNPIKFEDLNFFDCNDVGPYIILTIALIVTEMKGRKA